MAYANFNALGQPGLTTYANGVTTQYQYLTTNNRLYSITTNSPSAGGLQNLSYTYDYVGNITQIQDIIDTNRTQNLSYDHLNRLTQAVSTSYGTLTYQYSEIGNITYNSQLGTYTYGTRPHAVTQAGTNTYTYDANGNMINKAGVTITYDYDNRPQGSGTTSFVYDSSGFRVKKVTPSATITYVGKHYECTDGVCKKYVFGGSARVAVKTATNTYYYHSDHLGSSSIVTDDTGNKSEEIYYYPFGGTRQDTGAVSVKHKFTGQGLDDETGLYYYGARYYDPQLGRFISPDSIVQAPFDPQTLNRYSYCRNNPVYFVDPNGHDFGLSAIIIGAAIGALMAGIQSDWDVQAMAMGAAAGAITGACFAGANWAISQLNTLAFEAVMGATNVVYGVPITVSAMTQGAVYVAAGAIGGAAVSGLNAAYYGGNVGDGMLTGAAYGAAGAAATWGIGQLYSWATSPENGIPNGGITQQETQQGAQMEVTTKIVGDLSPVYQKVADATPFLKAAGIEFRNGEIWLQGRVDLIYIAADGSRTVLRWEDLGRPLLTAAGETSGEKIGMFYGARAGVYLGAIVGSGCPPIAPVSIAVGGLSGAGVGYLGGKFIGSLLGETAADYLFGPSYAH